MSRALPTLPAATVIVVAGGEPPIPAELAGLPPDSVVIGADRGVAHAQRLGLSVTLAVGDFDSVSADALERAAANGAQIRRHRAEKDATDLELALDAAAEYTPDRVVVLGAHGGRLDHHLANVLLLASPRYARLRIRARMGEATLTVIHREETLHGKLGELLTLLPIHGPVSGIVTSGLRYPLHGEQLPAGSSRGVSNAFAEATATVALSAGVLLAIQPERVV